MMLATAPVNALAGLAAPLPSRLAATVVTHQLTLHGEAQNIELVCATAALVASGSAVTGMPLTSDGHEPRGSVHVEVFGADGPGQNVVGYGDAQCISEAVLADQLDAAIPATQVAWMQQRTGANKVEMPVHDSSPLTTLEVVTLRFTLDPGVIVYGFAFAI